ncbi:RNA-binding domain-containing protein [Chloropicon primus]|uniref:RNA-binding domain-containing protein n=3 Tax=Chloropicon primus TaxID=1764295 RepID=A0A5B8MY86_9CHLO|nr:RNA-binding domain-containing protein [Chloropicon primus]UPR03562.1 RNA-binding domain-containing protein [Chloropicon primus]|eukprot:QDZ24354.1 RNA-binding domain-containing protein [Chloropicon primus]
MGRGGGGEGDDLDALYGDVGGLGEGEDGGHNGSRSVGEPGASVAPEPDTSAKQSSLEHVYQKYQPTASPSSQPSKVANRGGTPASDKQGGSLSVYLGNLQWWTTDVEVENACKEFGRIDSMRFYEDKVNGKSKGYVLVTFVDEEGAKACQEKLNGREMNGKKVVAAFQHQQQQQPQASKGGYGQGGYGQSAGGPSQGSGRPMARTGGAPYGGGHRAPYRGSGGRSYRSGGGGGYRDGYRRY